MRQVTFVLVLVILLMMGMTAFAQPNDGALDGDSDSGSVVPEPATILLLGAGLAVVAYAGWRRNRKK